MNYHTHLISGVVNKKSSASELPHSPYLGTARRQSQPAPTPSRNEGEQLARAAAYIRERISRRSLASNESVRCSPAVPPDKIGDPESDSRRLETRVVNKEKETSVTIRSPVSEGSESPLVRPDASLQQLKTRRAEELSSEYSEAIPWLPGPVLDEANSQRQRNLHAVNNVEASMDASSPVPNTALTPLYTSASIYPTQTYPSFQSRHVLLGSHQLVLPSTRSSVDLDWFDTSRQRPWDVINTLINPASTSQYSPESKTEGTKTSPLSSVTGRSPQHVPSFPLQDAPYRLDGAVIQRCNLHAISNVKTNTVWCSLDSPAVPLPRSHQFRPKPPELPVSRLGSSKRYSLDIVNTKSDLSTSQYLPKSMAVFTPPVPKRASQTFALDLGCGLDMLSRMMRIPRVITFRAIRNPKAEEMQYTIILEYIEDDETPSSAPPYIYIDTKTTANAVPFLPPKPSWWAETPGSVCVDLAWRARCKPPNIAVDSRRQNYSVVNKMNNPGDEHSPLYRAVRILPKPSTLIRIDCLRPRRKPNLDISQYTSAPARQPRHCRSFASLVVVLLRYLRIDSEG